MLTFVIIGAVGLMLVLLSMVVGEFIDFGDGVLSGTSLGVGGLVFGAVGLITRANGLSDLWTYVGSAAVALIVLVLVQLTIKRLRDTEDGKPVSLVGVTGIAMSDIGNTTGEVNLDHPREMERRMAWADERITSGSRIKVIVHAGSRVKVVAAKFVTEPETD